MSLLIQRNELQLSALREFAKAKGFEIVDTYIDTITGDADRRIGVHRRYDDLIKDAEAKKFQGVLVWKLDRLSRSWAELGMILKSFQKLDLDLISATQPIDTTSSFGRAIYGIMAVFAELERETISERMRAGRKYVQDHGVNSKGEPTILGRPEEVTEEKKASILRRFAANEKLKEIALAEGMPLPTVYSILKRTVIPCEHGKYRCKQCRKSRGIPKGSASTTDERALG